MVEAELVWVRECESCGGEHRKEMAVSVPDVDAIEAANAEFEAECERWFEAHAEVALKSVEGAKAQLRDSGYLLDLSLSEPTTPDYAARGHANGKDRAKTSA